MFQVCHTMQFSKFEMVGGYTKDLTKPENCQNGEKVHAQEWAVALLQ